MPELSQTPKVTIDGQTLSTALEDELIEVVVDLHLSLPDAFTLRFSDHGLDVADKLNAKIGSVVVIKAGALGDRPSAVLTMGEVTGFDASLDVDGRHFIVRGYDKSHRLQAGRKTTSFDDITDSALVQRMASAAGLTVGVIDSTTVTHKHVVQVNTSDWDFIRARAREIGYEAGMAEGKFYFRKPPTAVGRKPEIEFGQDLVEFRPRVSAAQQIKDVEVTSWDDQKKEAVTAKKSTNGGFVSLASSALAPKKMASQLGDAKEESTHRVLRSTPEAEGAASSLADEIASSHAEAEGVAIGDPLLKAGSVVKIKGVGSSFNGEWRLTRAEHRFSNGGYLTRFEVAGRQDRSLLGLASGAVAETPLVAGGTPIYGATVGVVSDSNDPLKQGRVKVQLPWLAADYATSWARVCYPGAGPERGFFNVPNVGDEVLVMFEHGDPRQPYIVGSLYNGKDKVPNDAVLDSGDGSVVKRTWVNTKKHSITLNDKAGEEGITITLNGDSHFFALKKDDDVVQVHSNGKTVVIGKKGIEITSDSGDVTIKGVNVKIEASAGLELKGATGKFDGGGSTEIKGGTIKLN